MVKEREGKRIYEECGIDLRAHPINPNEYNLYIGKDAFLLQRGVLESYAENVPVLPLGNLARILKVHNPELYMVLEEHKISPEGLALILSRARINELEKELATVSQ